MPRVTTAGTRGGTPVLRTAPVLAVLVCHDGEEWLPNALNALRRSTPRPRHVLAVDTGSLDGTPQLLSEATGGEDRVLDGVLTLDRETGFAAAVQDAVSAAIERWGDPGGWIWVLHDDCAPDPDCLATLLTAADASPSAGVLGPLALDWDDPRLVVEAGLSTDASGHRQTGIGPAELDWSRLGKSAEFGQSTEVLAVPSAGMLVRRDLWERLGGFDPAITLLREDIDFGWRANRAGSVVLCVPAARMRHVRAVTSRLRRVDAPRTSTRVVDRAQGIRTFLVNCSLPSFVLGVPRLVLLCLVRALGFGMQRRLDECRAELGAAGYVLSGTAELLEGRTLRRANVQVRSVHGLFTSRLTRLRNGVRASIAHLVRRRLQADAALGRLPDATNGEAVWLPAAESVKLPVGPGALPAGAGGRPRRPAGLRQPATSVAVSLAVPTAEPPKGLRPSPHRRPSPVPRDGSAPLPPDLVLVQVNRARLARQVLLAPPVLLVAGLAGLGLLVNAGRLGLDLAGGRLLPVTGLAETWTAYLAAWHPVAGGTAAPAPPALAVVGGLGAILAPFGGTQAAVAVLLIGNLPIAGLFAYLATRRLPVHRWVRALVAAAYALLPPATAAVAQGRLDVVIAHVLLPPVLAGIVALLGRSSAVQTAYETTWLSTAAATAFGLAVIGAFSPLTHVLLVGYALAGFVVLPGHRGTGRRRVVALFVLVLMPLALLLPWPAVVIQHPGVVVHGVGAVAGTPPVSALELASLDPGGPGAWPYLGFLVGAAVLVGLAVRPRWAALPGLALAALGAAAVVAVQTVDAAPITGGAPVPGWAGAGLLVVGWGLLHALLAVSGVTERAPSGLRSAREGARGGGVKGHGEVGGAGAEHATREDGVLAEERSDHVNVCRTTGREPIRWVRPVAALGALAVLAMATGVLVAGRAGPLTADPPRLATTLTRELADTGRVVLVLSDPRMVAGRMPAFGDDDLAPVNGGAGMRSIADTLSADPRVGVARAAAAGVLFVVLPSSAEAARLREAAGDLVADAPPTTDGHPVLRLQPAAGPVTLLSPELARRAVTGGDPPTSLGAAGIVPVEAGPPAVAVRVSDGPAGRLLVLAAEEEPGWQASVDGDAVPVVRAWGHLVGVALPTRAAEVRVEQPTALRSVLLLTQAAMVLFTLLTAIPSRRPR